MGMEQLPFWRRLSQHPAYDEYLAGPGGRPHPRREAAHRPHPARRQRVGPGGHLRRSRGVQRGQGQHPTPISCSAPGTTARPMARRARSARSTGARTPASGSAQNVLIPFLDQHLKGGPPADIARVTAFEVGPNHWQRLADWPPPAPAAARRTYAALPRARQAPQLRRARGRGVRLLHLRPRRARSPIASAPTSRPGRRARPGAIWLERRPALRRGAPRRPHLLDRAADPPLTPRRARRSSISSPRPAAPTATGWSS